MEEHQRPVGFQESPAWLTRPILAMLVAITALSVTATPVSAHKDHKAKQEAAQLEARRAAVDGSTQSAPMPHDAGKDATRR